jgi:hypothetical protein
MKCHEAEQHLSEYLEGDLSAILHREVHSHLQECDACRFLLEGLRLVLSCCESYPDLTPPANLVDKILGHTSGHFQALSWRDYLRELFKPLYTTPRFAAGTCMAVISCVLVLNALGVRWSQVRQVQLSNLTPRAIFQSFNRNVYLAYDSTVRRLNELKILYQIQSKLDEFRSQQTESKEAPKDKPKESEKPHENSSMEYMIARWQKGLEIFDSKDTSL